MFYVYWPVNEIGERKEVSVRGHLDEVKVMSVFWVSSKDTF